MKKTLKELPDDADLGLPEWSWAFSRESDHGVLRQSVGGDIIEYELPLAVCQLVVKVREDAKFGIQCTIKRALGL